MALGFLWFFSRSRLGFTLMHGYMYTHSFWFHTERGIGIGLESIVTDALTETFIYIDSNGKLLYMFIYSPSFIRFRRCMTRK